MNELGRPNSHAYKAQQAAGQPEPKRPAPKTGKVTSGEIGRNIPLKKKIGKALFNGDLASTKDYIIMSVLFPKIQDIMLDILNKGASMLIYGDSRNASTAKKTVTKAGYTGYFSSGSSVQKPQQSMPAPDDNKITEVGDVLFKDRGDAEVVRDTMLEIIEQYGQASFADFLDAIQVTSDWPDHGRGWTDLRQSQVTRAPGGFVLVFPKPVSFKPTQQ